MAQLPSKLGGTPQDLADRLAATPEVAEVVRASAGASEALDRLHEAGQLVGAVRLAALALPPREAVWWACMCADHTAPADLAEALRAARAAAERWVRQPAEGARRAAMAAATAAGLDSPEAWAGVAAFWSGGSMAPEGQPEVIAPPHLCGTAVSGAVLLASVRGDPVRQPARMGRFIVSAREIAAGQTGRLPPEEG